MAAFKPAKQGLSFNDMRGKTAVHLNGHKVGEIWPRSFGKAWAYHPNGGGLCGEEFPTLAACKASLV